MRSVKKVKKIMHNESLNKAFKRIVGVDEIDPHIIAEKYDNLVGQMNSFLILLEHMLDEQVTKAYAYLKLDPIFNKIADVIDEYRQILADVKIQCYNEKFSTKLAEINASDNKEEMLTNLLTQTKYNEDELRVKYNELIKSPLFKTVIVLATNVSQALKSHKITVDSEEDDFADKHNLKYDFIIAKKCKVLDFVDLSWDIFFISGSAPVSVKKYLLKMVYMLHSTCTGALEEYCRPNIDCAECVNAIYEALTHARTMVDRCDDAFDIMIQTLDGFKDKFPEYYKAFVITGNPYIILERFVGDVSKKCASYSLGVKQQFSKIVTHFSNMKKQANMSNEEMDDIFGLAETLNINLDI